jgi:hypothetical protein
MSHISSSSSSSSSSSTEHECELIEEKCNNNDENISKVNNNHHNLISSNQEDNNNNNTLVNESTAKIETNIFTNSSKLDFATSNNTHLNASPEQVPSSNEEASSQTVQNTATAEDYASFEQFGKNLNSLTIVSDLNNLTENRNQNTFETTKVFSKKKIYQII